MKDIFGMSKYDFITGKPIKNSSKRSKCPPHLRTSIRRRWWGDNSLKGQCFVCGRSLHYDDADVGHIKASSKGGAWAPENCRLICRQCNSGMGSKNMKSYMKSHYPERYKKFFPPTQKPIIRPPREIKKPEKDKGFMSWVMKS